MAQRNGGAVRFPSAATTSSTYPGSAVRVGQPRVHPSRSATLRPSAPSASPQGGSIEQQQSAADLIRLTDPPRPDMQRLQNEYVDTPLGGGTASSGAGTSLHRVPLPHRTVIHPAAGVHQHTLPIPSKSPSAKRSQSVRSKCGGGVVGSSSSSSSSTSTSSSQQQQPLPPPPPPGGTLPVTKQPGAVTFKKEAPCEVSESQCSIICQDCGRCRCEACRRPRPLPSKWLCNEACLCAPETVLDYASCVCCVKAVFYHCSKDYDVDRDGASCADKPCSCLPHRRCLRWGCMGLMSLALPCLLCYWPLKGSLKLCELCYQKVHNQGCHCVQRNHHRADAGTPVKRLLDSNSDC